MDEFYDELTDWWWFYFGQLQIRRRRKDGRHQLTLKQLLVWNLPVVRAHPLLAAMIASTIIYREQATQAPCITTPLIIAVNQRW